MIPIISTGPSKGDLKIYQGDDYAAEVSVTGSDGLPFDLTGYTAQAQLRRDVADKEPAVAAQFVATVQTPGLIELWIPHAATRTLEGVYVWDLQITSVSGAITTILAGKATVTAEVTRNGSQRAAYSYGRA